MPDFSFDDSFASLICGFDEVGRGPLAGPVVAACVIVPRNLRKKSFWQDVNDSKKLSVGKREEMNESIRHHALWGIGEVLPAEIDKINILQASFEAMRRSFEMMRGQFKKPCTDILGLIDGSRAPKDFPCRAKTVVKGDTKSPSIAAASIIAKVHRDRLMCDLAIEFPGYGWERNAGYPTPEHLDALARLGPTPQHRRSFAPVRAILESKLKIAV